MYRYLQKHLHNLRIKLHHMFPSILTLPNIEYTLLHPSSLKKSTSTTTSNTNTIALPQNQYPNLQQYLQMFFNSVAQNGRPNGQNLLFVTGMEGAGKTALVAKALREFRTRKGLSGGKGKGKREGDMKLRYGVLSSPEYEQDLLRRQTTSNKYHCIIQLNYPSPQISKPQSFFHTLSQKITKKLVTLSTQIKHHQNLDLLSPQILSQIVLADHDPNYIYMYVKDVLWNVVNGTQGILLGKFGVQAVDGVLGGLGEVTGVRFFRPGKGGEKGKGNQGNEGDFCFGGVVKIFAEDLKVSQLEAAFMILLSAFRRVEYEHRPEKYLESGYVTGIQTTKFLFSVLNYICGFGNLNKQTIQAHINSHSHSHSHSSPTPMPTATSTSVLSTGTHIDTILTIQHLQNLSCYNNPKMQKWLDLVLILAHNSSNIRTHFPIIMQLKDSATLQKLQKCGRMLIDNPTVMELPAYFVTNLYRYMPGLLVNNNTVDLMRGVLGRNPKVWNQAFVELAKGVSLNSILSGSAAFMQKTSSKLQNRLNRLYLNPENLPLLDNNTLDLHILSNLYLLDKTNGCLRTNFLRLNQHVLHSPIFRQLYEQSIVHESYYFSAVSLCDARDLGPIRDILRIRKLGIKKWLQFHRFRKFQWQDGFWIRQLKYNDAVEKESFKRDGVQNQSSEYLLREYYGQLRDYRITNYVRVLKHRFNI